MVALALARKPDFILFFLIFFIILYNLNEACVGTTQFIRGGGVSFFGFHLL